MTDSQIITFFKGVETGAVTDAMNLVQMGGWMDKILPMDDHLKLCGKAFTVRFEKNPPPGTPVLNIFEVMDLVEKEDVMVLSVPGDSAIVGENIMNALCGKGIAGMVLDGKARDTGIIRRDRLPLFCKGPCIRLETECKITAVQVPVTCGGTAVNPGDYIVGDSDGVICISAAQAEKLIYQIERIVKIEDELEQGIKSKVSMKRIAQISLKKKSLRVE